MELSSDLISQFAKITNDSNKSKENNIVYGTVVNYANEPYVKIDGSDLLTPASTMTSVKVGDRVSIILENHTASINGNLTSPSVNSGDIDASVAQFNTIIADKASINDLTASNARITILETNSVTTSDLQAATARIDSLEADVADLGDLSAINADIENLKANALTATTADLLYASIGSLQATNATVNSLQTTYQTISGEVSANTASISNLGATYANIDFSNISEATMASFYATSGLIQNATVNNATITGSLQGVTISGDLIVANTLKAEKLLLLGSDGLFHRINSLAETNESQQDSGGTTPANANCIDGRVILANSINASKINVTDLTAFGATIAQINMDRIIGLYTTAKTTIDSTVNGFILKPDGQVNIGGTNGYIKLKKEYDDVAQNYNYNLTIVANEITLKSTNVNYQDQTISASTFKILSDSISSLIQDDSGQSVINQTSSGFSVTISDLLNRSGFINLTTDSSNNPCIELGKTDNRFKLLITNSAINFMDGFNTDTKVDVDGLITENVSVGNEFKHGKFVWKTRENGNLGLSWKGD